MKNSSLDKEYQRLVKAESAIRAAEKTARDRLQDRVQQAVEILEKAWTRRSHIDPMSITHSEGMELSNKLDRIAEIASYLGSYVEYKDIDRAEKRRKAVRKALGYTYP